MDRLLVIDPNELVFQFEIGQRCTGVVTLRNVMFTMPVAFKITATPAKKYSIKPSQGIIPPAASAILEVTMSPQQALPDSYPICTSDKFVVKSMVVPGGNQNSSVSNEWFESKKNFVYSDSCLKVVLLGACVLRALIARGTMEEVRELLEAGAVGLVRSNGAEASPLHVAISNARAEMVQILLEFGADLEARDRSGRTPLHEAAASGQALVTELLLANGASTEARTESGHWTPLHLAVDGGHVEVVRVLLARGADASAVTGSGDRRTAAHMAAAAGNECLRLLLDAGGDAAAAAANGQTPLHVAAARGDAAAVRLLLSRGAVRNAVDATGRSPFDEAVAPEIPDSDVLDALRLGDDLRRAARRGDARGVRSALRRGARIDGGDQNGWTALHCAAFKGHVDVVELLLEKGADAAAADVEGYTPLHCAVEVGHAEVGRLLAARHGGGLLTKCCSRGLTPVHLARALGREEVVKAISSVDLPSLSSSKNDDENSPRVMKKRSSNLNKEAPASVFSAAPARRALAH